MLRIIHCITDEKFAKGIIKTFDFLSDRCNSRYIHITESIRGQYKFLSSLESVEFYSVEQLLNELSVGCCDYLLLHNLQSFPLNSISKIPPIIKVVWLSWGFDIYGYIGSKPLVFVPNQIQPITNSLLWSSWTNQVKENAKTFLKVFRNKALRNAVSRIDYFSGIIPEEYEMMCANPFFTAKQIDFRYASPLSSVSSLLLETEKPVKGMDILVGNSGDPTNNHADIFMKLSAIDLGDRRIYVPLSYGNNYKYRLSVKRLGKELWGDRFIAIDDFLPYDSYKQIISSCGFRFFGHERQQALGNIIMSFRDGCSVFLSESSILYNHLQKTGLKIFSIQKDISIESLSCLMSEKDSYNNRKIMIEYSCTTKQITRLYNMIDFFNSELELC